MKINAKAISIYVVHGIFYEALTYKDYYLEVTFN